MTQTTWRLTDMATKKRKGSRPPRPTANTISPEMDLLIQQAAKEAAGKPLSETLNPESGSLMSQMMGRLIEIAMSEEMTEHLGYEPYERQSRDELLTAGSDGHQNNRNGHYDKPVKTTVGETSIRVLRDRDGSFEPQIVPKGASISKELEERIISMYTMGMSTRDISEHLQKLYGVPANSAFISRLSAKLDTELSQWRNRPLEQVFGIIFVDAIHIKVRHAQGVRSTAVYQVCGYNEDGKMEILGVYMAPPGQTGESAKFWHQVFIQLQGRGLEDVLILCSDGLTGLVKAARSVWPACVHQPCVVHLVRNSTKNVHHTDRQAVCTGLREIYKAASYEAAGVACGQFCEQWQDKYPVVARQWADNLEVLEEMWTFSPRLRKLIYTTNAIENIHSVQRKVLKTKRSFPNLDSGLRLMTLLARKITNKNLDKSKGKQGWRLIVAELCIHFEGRIPSHWGSMYS
jgi:putative transposase